MFRPVNVAGGAGGLEGGPRSRLSAPQPSLVFLPDTSWAHAAL